VRTFGDFFVLFEQKVDESDTGGQADEDGQSGERKLSERVHF
jgi:hypothetical protein